MSRPREPDLAKSGLTVEEQTPNLSPTLSQKQTPKSSFKSTRQSRTK